jgi:DNA repair exonuclease SbcCD nuclease subunit
MAVRLLHTADWQIGMKAAHLGPAVPRAREARLETARRIAELARAEKADLAILAGDTFEHPAVPLDDVGRVARALADFGCPVIVLPGNHDPLGAGSLWELPVWDECPNVRIARLESPIELESCVVFPCPLRSRWGTGDPTAWIPSGQFGDRIRIGTAHGAVAGLPNQEQTCSIPADAPALRRLDYLALGDWHSARQYRSPDGAVRMAYSGTPEPASFAEDASGFVLLVDIDSPGAAPRIRQERVARLRWIREEFQILESGALAAVLRKLEALASPETVAELHLAGALYPEDHGTLAALRQLASRFLFLRIDDGLRPVLRLEDLPDGPLREAARRLDQLALQEDQSAEARQALQTLLTLAKGAGA